jgi:hypothetical protein
MYWLSQEVEAVGARVPLLNLLEVGVVEVV